MNPRRTLSRLYALILCTALACLVAACGLLQGGSARFPTATLVCVLQNDTLPIAQIAEKCGGIAISDVQNILSETRAYEARRYACTPARGDAGLDGSHE